MFCRGKVDLPRLFHCLIRTVFVDAVLKVLGHGVPGYMGLIRGLQLESRIFHQLRDRALDDPHPEGLAFDTGPVQIHQDRGSRALILRLRYLVPCRIAHG